LTAQRSKFFYPAEGSWQSELLAAGSIVAKAQRRQPDGNAEKYKKERFIYKAKKGF